MQDKNPGIAGLKKPKARLSKNDPLVAAFLLFIIATLVTFALAGANELTKDRIAAQEKIDRENAQTEVFPDAASFEDLTADFVTDETPAVQSVYKALDGTHALLGLVITTISKGYGGDITVMSGIKTDGTVLGIKVLSDDETPGLGKKVNEVSFCSQFTGRTPGKRFSVQQEGPDHNEVDAVTGATISSAAMVDAVNSALAFADRVYPGLK